MSYETVLNGKISGSTGSDSSSSNYEKYGIWMLDYKTSGENSYVHQDKRIWKEFMESPIAINDTATNGLALSWALEQGGHAGKVIGSMYGMDQTPDWNSLSTVSNICSNETAWNAVMNDERTRYMVFRYNNYEIIDYHSDLIYSTLNDSYPELIDELIASDKYKNNVVTRTSTTNEYGILLSATNKIGANIATWVNDNASNVEYKYIILHAYARTGVLYKKLNQETVTLTDIGVNTNQQFFCYPGNTANLSSYQSNKNPFTVSNFKDIKKIIKNGCSFYVAQGTNTYRQQGYTTTYRYDSSAGSSYRSLDQGLTSYVSVSGGSYTIIPL